MLIKMRRIRREREGEKGREKERDVATERRIEIVRERGREKEERPLCS